MKSWTKWLILGILSVVFGLFALGNAVAASMAVTIVTGLLFLILGGIQVFLGLSETGTGRKIFSVAMGVLMLFLGVSFIANPLEGVISLALLVTIMLAASGILRLVLAWGMKSTPYFWPMLLSGALSVLLAGYIIANFAVASVSLLGILLGIELLFNGSGLIALAFFVRAHRK
ncbi:MULTISPECIES: HdeD family acid-resistance protein [unclassified Meridianimarinicoccus]|uniref:HdeD family acid-resistance protein n=1 Tax=unclassified Meridianimarinicoccus TaxID=2923344 RepID=UPI00186756C8|nr:DUF308 domain-containing protein [Fluviibacterium sp. MJW13]